MLKFAEDFWFTFNWKLKFTLGVFWLRTVHFV